MKEGLGIGAFSALPDDTLSMFTKFIAVIILVLVLIAPPDRSAAGAADIVPPDSSSWAQATIPSALDLNIPQSSPNREAANPKLDSALSSLAVASPGERRSLSEAAGLRFERGRVQVQILIQPQNEAVAHQAVAAANGEVTGSYENVLQVWVPPDHLTSLAVDPAIEFIQAPLLAELLDESAVAAVTEGLLPANVPTWHGAGWRGQGIKIAIIDSRFGGYEGKLGSELPEVVTARNFVDNQSIAEMNNDSNPHGTACAEIVHDMAPAAHLYLLKISTDIDLAEAVDYAIAQEVDIISTSLTFINATPGDGTGRFQQMAQEARDAGILWVTAAGNYRETHWAGTFTDNDGDGLHEYTSGTEVNVFGPGNNTAYLIPAGVNLALSIRWDDWITPDEDYRLLLLRHNGSEFQIAAGSDNLQNGLSSQRPTERINFVTSGAAAIYGVAIQRIDSDRNVYLHLLTPNRELDRRVPAMSLGNLADVAAVLTVAAVDVDAPYVREDYSSEGPTNGPGGTAGGGFRKPDLAAFANVTTASFGTRGFNGTSAAAPHVAGAAALVLNAYPGARPGELQDYLQTRAVNQGIPGPDTQFGFGRLRLDAPPGPWDFDYHAFIPMVSGAR